MKLIIAYIKPERLNAVKQELYKRDIFKMSVSNALGCGQQKGYVETYRGAISEVNLLKKDLEYILVSDGEVLGKPLMTILQNDLQYYKENMKAGRNSEAVLVFEIDGKQKLQNPVIQVTDGKVTGEIAVH